MYRLLEGRLPSFIDGRVLFNPEHVFRIGATRKTRKNEKKTFPNHGIFPMDSPIINKVFFATNETFTNAFQYVIVNS